MAQEAFKTAPREGLQGGPERKFRAIGLKMARRASQRPSRSSKRPPKGLSWALWKPPRGLQGLTQASESFVLYEGFVLRGHLMPSPAILSHLQPQDGFQEALKRPQEAPKGPVLSPPEASWDLQGAPEAAESIVFYVAFVLRSYLS